ncbi:Lcl domain-containing protein [Thiocystis violacea]|uniref:Lcl domain-containing protein n=1 Tax=Thiocystis violacea TaxID=13725 RepID=UPI0019064A34|nr:DUF1566 domain-containing protein [Thiocystis violacea]MBK1723021.1 hypothetical protein [Thiocystis violacea]
MKPLSIFLIGLAWLALADMVLAGTCQHGIPASNPDSVYTTDLSAGTVTDTRTGLMWKTCVEGQTWSGGTCTRGGATSHPWAAALDLAESATFAGHDDWRLPNVNELMSLVEPCRTNPSINDSLFPNTPTWYVWSGSPNVSFSDHAWYVLFSYGFAEYFVRSEDVHVRLVRGGQSFDPLPAAGLSCTTNTLGLPLDSTACFYDGSDNWRKAILKKAGVVVAEASVVGNQGGFCANNLLWQDASGTPISDWSGLFAGADTATVEISAERPDGSTVVLGTRTASRSQFDVTVTSDQTFPVSGPYAEVDFTATPAGGTAPYTYQWTEVLFAPLGYGHHDWGSDATTSIELSTSVHPINLRVTDSAGQVATVECLAAVTVPYLNGDPALSGSGSRLMRGVDVATGNYHRSTTDLSVSGKGPDFAVTRAYNANGSKIGAWSFNVDMRLGFGGMPPTIAIGPREDGRSINYYRESDGTWRALNPGNFDELTENADGTFTLYTQGNLLYRFAAPKGAGAGRLETIEDRDDNVLSFSHDTDNRITGATDASGRSFTVTRDASGRITRVSDFAGRYVQYTWNADGMITAVRNPRGHSTIYGYRAGSNAFDRSKLASITDPRGNVQATITYYDSGSLEGKVESVTDGAGNEWGYVHGLEQSSGVADSGITRPTVNGVNNNIVFILDDARTRVVERVDSIGVGDYRSRTAYKTTTERTRIPEMALPVETYRPSNAKTTIAYTADGRGNPATITDPLGRETPATRAEVAGQTNLTPLATVQRPGVPTPTRYSDFTPSGKAETVVDPLNQSTGRDFDDQGLLKQTTDARGNSTDIEYDDAGRPIQVTDALGHVTATSYDDLGRVLTQTNARGYITRFTYDANGNRLTTTNPANGVTTNVYDASDNLVSTTDPRGNTTSFVYDAFNRKIEERYTVGGQQRVRGFAYDAMGRLYRVTNEKGHDSDTHFDARGKVLQEINPLSQTITYTYDANGNVLTVTDAEGRRITNTYDALDRKIQVTDALGNEEAFTYNDQGLLASRRDARGQLTRYEYDALGQMTKVIDPSGGQTLASYDANGNLASTTDPNGHTTTYSYDAADRLTQLTDAEGRQWTFSHDANGNRLTQTTPSGQTTSYSYDTLDRVTSVTYPGGPTVGYTYDANGNRKTMTDANGTTQYSYDERNRLTSVTDAFGNTVAYRYDAAGQMDRLTYPGNRSVDYSHDDAGRLASLADWLGDTTNYTRYDNGAVKTIQYGNGARVEKRYDAGSRLTSLVNHNAANGVISSHTLTLDGLGNPLSADVDLPLQPANLGRTAEQFYDASNRLTSTAGAAITHDDDGRVTADPSGSAAIQYAYNAQDLITSVTAGGVLTDSYSYDGDGRRVARTSGGQTTRYVLDPTGGDLYSVLAETDGGNNVQHYYLYGEGLVAQITGNSHRYYHFDQTGNTLALTDDSGLVTDSYAYEPFGNVTAQGSSYNPFRFVGRYGVMDDGNGLNHMRARYYRADLGRFLSLDEQYGEAGNPESLNRYQYASGNPMTKEDATGLAANYTSDEIQRRIKAIRAKKKYLQLKAEYLRKNGIQEKIAQSQSNKGAKSDLTVLPDAMIGSMGNSPSDWAGVAWDLSSDFSLETLGDGPNVKNAIRGFAVNTLCNEALDIAVSLYNGGRTEENVANTQEACSIALDVSNPGYVLFSFANQIYRIRTKGIAGAGEWEFSMRLDEFNQAVISSSTFQKFVDESFGNQHLANEAKKNAGFGILMSISAQAVNLIGKINPMQPGSVGTSFVPYVGGSEPLTGPGSTTP